MLRAGIPLANVVCSVCVVPAWANCKLRPGWLGDGECAGMRAEASLSGSAR